jgi:hypothetical protein
MSYLKDSVIRADRAAVLRALYEVYPRPLGESLLIDELARSQRVVLTAEAMHRALDYLEGAGRIIFLQRQLAWIVKISPVGIDWIESDEHFDAKVADQMRMLRLRTLQALRALQLRPMAEDMIAKYLVQDEDLMPTPERIHRACAYLTDIGFAAWAGGNILRITYQGIDYLEGANEDILGIRRPGKL